MLRFQWRPASTLIFALFLAIILPGSVFAGGLAPLFSTNELSAEYAGESAFLLEAGTIEPLSLASADLDEDGVPDLVVGYGDGADGFFVVHRGNLEAIYPRPGDEAGPAFLPQAQVFESLTRADHIATGDFDADGHFDIVAASDGGSILELHRGDGTGRFAMPESIDLGGRLTAMAVGEVNRRDGHPDVVVGVDHPSGPKILVFESPLGALRDAPELIDAIETVTSIDLGNHDDDLMRDIAAVTESYRIDVKGRDRRLSLGRKQRAEVAEAIVSTEPVLVHAKKSDPPTFAELLDGEIVARLTMRLNRDAFPDSVVIVEGQPNPVVVKTLTRAIFTVDSTADDPDFDTGDGVCDTDDSVGDGPCTLRAAIEQANASAGADAIEFDITGPGPHVIQPTSRIPFITESVTIDGTTEPDYVDLPVVEVDGLLSPPTGDLHGFQIESAGNTTFRGLSVYRFENHGIVFRFVGGNIVEGCIAGTNAAGATGLGNGWGGIGFWSCSGNTVGGTTPQARNIASGNNSGIGCGTDDTVQGNWMGLDPTGTTAIPNYTGAGTGGVGCTFGGVTAGAGNVVSGNDAATNQGVGIWIGSSSTTDTLIHGNLIGTDPTGTIAIGNTGEGILIKFTDGATIGGTSPAMRNVISGNYYGIVTESTAENALIQGNYIGTDITGMIALANEGVGVAIGSGDGSVVGGAVPGAGNLVSGNLNGVSVATGNNTVQGNLIGTDATGVGPLPNEIHGVAVGGSSNVIGGINPGEANVIAFNDGHGVRVYPGTGHSILGNSIHSNTGINSYYIPGNGFGIELGYEDEIAINDPGDPDTGVNNLQNYPVLTTVTSGGATVNGSLNSTLSTQFDLHFYANAACDASGYGEGETYLGSDTVTTDGAGDVAFSSLMTTPVPPGSYVTATATAPDGSTSEFSACIQFTVEADLAITKDDGTTVVIAGTQTTYIIVASNSSGPSSVFGATVTDTFPPELSCSWTCIAAGSATCTAGPVAGDIVDSVDLPVGGTATYTAVCDITPATEGPITNTVTVTSPPGVNDPVPGNNSATDIDGVIGLDFGDAPDPSYSTLFANDGARHVFGGAYYLGTTVDVDFDGQPTANADGDDTDGNDDDDGVVFTSVPVTGLTAYLDVTSSAGGLLNAWVDFNADGDWADAGEQIFTDEVLVVGVNSLGVPIPATATLGQTFARFRVDTGGGLTPTGLAMNGEVEDYALEIRSSTLDIPKTGQTTSYAAGDDGTFQFGVPWPEPRFTDNLDGTMTDELTGLMWTQDNDTPGPPACSPNIGKPWFDSLLHVDCLNANSYLGYTNWRMPNIIELQSLVDYSVADHNTWWASQGFTLAPGFYWWSGNTSPSGLLAAWRIDFAGASSPSNKNSGLDMAVWPVRGTSEGGVVRLPKTGQIRCWDATYAEVPCAGTGQDGEHQAGVEWPSPRFEVSGDCVTDRMTGLVWAKDANLYGERSWSDAVNDPLDLSLCGFDDWRLPNTRELTTLYHFDKRTGAVPPTMKAWWDSQGFVNTPVNSQYWSGTTDPRFPDIQAMVMAGGPGNKTGHSNLVWPVRGNLLNDAADLTIAMTGDPNPVAPGGTVTYTIDVSNLGPTSAEQVTVTDILPADTTFVDASGSGWSCGEDSGVVTCALASLAVGPAAPISIEVTAPSTTGSITNSALVDSLQSDPVSENNSADETTNVGEFDFGDAPDPTYPTLLASNGARHVIDGATYLGATVDAEPDGQPNIHATGDDNDAQGDDEDGISFITWPVAGQLCTIRVTASTAGVVNAWIDYNADGDWADAGEHVFADVAVVAGQNNLDYAIPITATTGVDTFARFRFSTAGGLSYDGPAPDGEVEDHKMGINALDYGDAPDPTYPTLDAGDGARHIIGGGLYLGASVDFEADGQPTVGADGDDNDGNDDEDGVVFTSGIGAGLVASVDVTASAAGLLNAWVDLNSDGDWTDAGEQIFTDQPLVTGVNPLSFAVPVGATLGSTYARFRLDTNGGLAPTGYATEGEVEDYQIEIVEGPDLEIAMVGSADPTASGHPLTYTITVTNNGPLPATSVTLTDTLPGELIFVSSTPGAPDCTFAGNTLTCDLGTMAPTDTSQVTIETVLDHPVWGTVSNTSSVTANETDPITANNAATADTTIALFVDGFESGDLTAWD